MVVDAIVVPVVSDVEVDVEKVLVRGVRVAAVVLVAEAVVGSHSVHPRQFCQEHFVDQTSLFDVHMLLQGNVVVSVVCV
jgi:hypothetical protein